MINDNGPNLADIVVFLAVVALVAALVWMATQAAVYGGA